MQRCIVTVRPLPPECLTHPVTLEATVNLGARHVIPDMGMLPGIPDMYPGTPGMCPGTPDMTTYLVTRTIRSRTIRRTRGSPAARRGSAVIALIRRRRLQGRMFPSIRRESS